MASARNSNSYLSYWDKLIRPLLTLVTLALISGFLFWAGLALLKYRGVPVASEVRYAYGDDGKGNVTFPEITVCSKSIAMLHLNESNCESPNNRHASISSLLLHCLTPDAINVTEPEKDEDENDYVGSMFGGIGLFDEPEPESYNVTVQSVLHAITFNISDIIKSVSFGPGWIESSWMDHGSKLEMFDEFWDSFLDNLKGQCFRFNASKSNYTDIMRIRHLVPEYGEHVLLRLTLTLNLKPIFERRRVWDYNTFATPALDVYVHHGSPEAEYVRVYDKNHYIITFDRTRFRSLNLDRRPCYDKEEDYSQDACFTREANRKIAERLNCRLPFYENDTLELCQGSIKNSEAQDIRFESVPEGTCPDLLGCSRTAYNIDFNTKWYTEGQQAKVTLKFKTPFVGIIEDNYAYDVQSLVGEVGGTLGMFLGASFLSLVELIVATLRNIFHMPKEFS